jgi:hypothetical protein
MPGVKKNLTGDAPLHPATLGHHPDMGSESPGESQVVADYEIDGRRFFILTLFIIRYILSNNKYY